MQQGAISALLLSAVGGRVCVDGRADEEIITAIADGVAYPGWCVNVLSTAGATQGDILAVDVAANDRFTGILLPTYAQDCDAIITNGTVCEIVIPKRGHYYNVAVEDLNADADLGAACEFGTTDGYLAIVETTIEVKDFMCVLSKSYDDNDLIAEVQWLM